VFSKYVISLYWAVVTCTTVGYGDILPSNNYELFWAMVIIVFGVAVFSYILSNLASQFMEISRSDAAN
jgi:cyclic nucleotide gated channel alpha 3